MPKRTKLAILQAFNKLAKKKDFDKITVEQICKEAEVSRATFYRYFEDKYDVMNYNYRLLIDEYMNPEHITTMEDMFVIFLEHSGDDYWKPLLGLFEVEGYNSLHYCIFKYSFEAAKKIMEDKGLILNQLDVLQMEFFTHGCSYFYEDWIRGRYPDMTVQEGAAAIYDMLPEKFHGNLWN